MDDNFSQLYTHSSDQTGRVLNSAGLPSMRENK